ncbi:MAG: gamma-glutamyltransferase [Bryobacteraceae bacterium]|nr:gamma-glutamyltransferase [Bryobacteraceae bacterium]
MRKPAIAAVFAMLCVAAAIAREPVRFRQAAVVAQEPLAADVGAEVLRRGGNAVDAAVAVAFALAVTHPSAGNIGGGGFLLARFADGRATFIDFREMAPLAASRNMYVGPDGKATEDSLIGWRAAAVPGTVRGLEMAHRKYGSRPWAELLAPAIRLAAEGVTLSYAEARSICGARARLGRFDESRRIFLKGGACFEPGEVLKQPELARTLERIARHGARDFYEGETARILAEEMKANGGLITLEDLRGYQAIEREPLKGSYRGYTILTAPPPSSGGIGILQMLGMLEGTGYEKHGAGSASSLHYIAEAMRRYFADRAEYLGDADFASVPIRGLLDPGYIATRKATIRPDRATPSAELGAGRPRRESEDTTHFNVIDAQGNAVALTYTINNSYGNAVTVPRLGFLLNNEMDDFAAQPGKPNMFGLIQGEANAIAPRKRPLSAMTPTIVEKDGRLVMALGAPGGPRIISGVLQVLLHVIDFGMDIQQAVDQPRVHHQWMPDRLYHERGLSPDTLALLRQRGHELAEIYAVGSVEAILVEEPRVRAVADATTTGSNVTDRIRWLAAAQNGRSAGKASGY